MYPKTINGLIDVDVAPDLLSSVGMQKNLATGRVSTVGWTEIEILQLLSY
jgi:hypothetical protein